MAASRESILENADAYTVDELFAFVADGTITLSSLRSSSATAEQISEVTKKVSEAEEAEKLEKQRQKAEAAERKRQQKEMKARESVRMYDNLKFSWGHIIAFLALIFMGYVTFVGLTYMLDDGFTRPLWITLGILAAIIAVFVGAQQFKGISNQHRRLTFARSIWIERALICISPLVLAACLVPLNHAWTIHNHAEEVEEGFDKSVLKSKDLFTSYDEYAQKRIDDYRKDLESSDWTGWPDEGKLRAINIEVDMLKMALTGKSSQLSQLALEWIDKAHTKSSVWNVFLIGNVHEIQRSFEKWSEELETFSEVRLSAERLYVYNFAVSRELSDIVMGGLDKLRAKCKNADGLQWQTIACGLLLYLFLLVPYLVQKRNGVSTYTLWGTRFNEDNNWSVLDSNVEKKRDSKSTKRNSNDDRTSQILEDDEEDSEELRNERRQQRRAKAILPKQEEELPTTQRRRRHHDNDDDDDFVIGGSID